MVDKEYSDAQEKIEPITYSPEVQDTIEVKEVCFSLCGNPDQFNNGATKLYYAVDVNGVERLTGYWEAPAGFKYEAKTLAEGQFNLGSETLFELFLWVDQGEVRSHGRRYWFAVGTNATEDDISPVIIIRHRGLISIGAEALQKGSGTATFRTKATTLAGGDDMSPIYTKGGVSDSVYIELPQALVADPGLYCHQSDSRYIVAYFSRILLVLRSEQ